MTAPEIQQALVKWLHWWEAYLLPEFSIEGGDRADLVQISKAGYATEFEIKISAADWRADLKKVKWKFVPQTGNKYVSRFYYVVPGRRVDGDVGRQVEPSIKPPPGLPDGAGVIVVLDDGQCVELVKARRWKVDRIPEETRKRALEAFYYRYWRLLEEHRRILGDYRDLAAKHARPA